MRRWCLSAAAALLAVLGVVGFGYQDGMQDVVSAYQDGGQQDGGPPGNEW